MILEMNKNEALFMYATLNAGKFTLDGDIEHNIKVASIVGTLKGKFRPDSLSVELSDEEVDFIRNMLEHTIPVMKESPISLFRSMSNIIHSIYERL